MNLFKFTCHNSANDANILEAVKQRFGGRNSLLDDFDIIDYQLHAIDERAMCVGTSIEG